MEGERHRMLSLANAMVTEGRFTYLIRFAQFAKLVQKVDDLLCSCLCLGGCWLNSTGGRAGDWLILVEFVAVLDTLKPACLEWFLWLPLDIYLNQSCVSAFRRIYQDLRIFQIQRCKLVKEQP